MSPHRRSRASTLWLAFGGLLVVLLAAAVFTLGSLSLPFEPTQPGEFTILFALSTFTVAALFVFGLILVRNLLRLWVERRTGQPGSGFRTKMVLGAMAISLLPVVFMFFISYGLLNRTLNRWFPRPLEIATEESQKLLLELGTAEHARLERLAREISRKFENLRANPELAPCLFATFAHEMGLDAAWYVDGSGRLRTCHYEGVPPTRAGPPPPRLSRTLPSGVEVLEDNGQWFLANRLALADGTLIVGRKVPNGFLTRYSEIETQAASYSASKQGLRVLKNQLLLTLTLLTVLLLFAATWFALFLSKMVTVPIQALAEGTREVSKGNLGYQVDVPARDELGTLVASFNRMTSQLGESQQQINDFTRNLQQALQEIEQRRKLMETILGNIPTGVVSLGPDGRITSVNEALTRILGDAAGQARQLSEMVGAEAARGIEQLMRRALRMGTATRELAIDAPGAGRVLHAAVTVSALGTRRSNSGYIVVIDDLTELLRAQKAAAWQEVAQRIAHEIKNPLTPIQLSAQRLARHVERAGTPAGAPNGELEKLIAECSGLIQQEVSTLKSLVDEFSQFARFPAPRPVTLTANSIVSSALDIFAGRLEGIKLRTELAEHLPAIKADPELMRRVVVNLIDNAAEAMEGATCRELNIATRLGPEGETVEIVVADSGHGIPPEDREKLFLPRFSTRSRGTGLGLAIASRIVTDHFGTIRAEDNQPAGARFVVRLPVMEVPVPAQENLG